MNMPTRMIPNVRVIIFFSTVAVGLKSYRCSERNVVIPIMNMKNGNTRSVGVRPHHEACLSGA